ncbi:hypothetical protein BDR03DRAFT_701388 [Suillus americanus]|nr:hypothetical protein BDR03DRAFT_701388 [Suillus americanus]
MTSSKRKFRRRSFVLLPSESRQSLYLTLYSFTIGVSVGRSPSIDTTQGLTTGYQDVPDDRKPRVSPPYSNKAMSGIGPSTSRGFFILKKRSRSPLACRETKLGRLTRVGMHHELILRKIPATLWSESHAWSMVSAGKFVSA